MLISAGWRVPGSIAVLLPSYSHLDFKLSSIVDWTLKNSPKNARDMRIHASDYAFPWWKTSLLLRKYLQREKIFVAWNFEHEYPVKIPDALLNMAAV